MSEYRFKRVETVMRTLTINGADSYEQAYARACVGSVEYVRKKEGVEISGYAECSETEPSFDVPRPACPACGK